MTGDKGHIARTIADIAAAEPRPTVLSGCHLCEGTGVVEVVDFTGPGWEPCPAHEQPPVGLIDRILDVIRMSA